MINKVEILWSKYFKITILTNERKQELFIKIKQGDEQARDRIYKWKFKISIKCNTEDFINKGENADDLFQIGCVGLIKAIDNFEVELKVFNFATYAVPMIIGEVKRYLRDNNCYTC